MATKALASIATEEHHACLQEGLFRDAAAAEKVMLGNRVA